jgi:hypothetical protein
MQKGLKGLRLWAQHVGLRLRRRGAGYSIYDHVNAHNDLQKPKPGHDHYRGSRVDPRKPGTRVDFQKQSQIGPWLEKWMDREIKRLGSDRD